MKKNLFLFLFLSTIFVAPIFGEQNLLQRVKNNPNEAIKLCKKLRNFNKGFDELNAEIYSAYAIGLHCPQVF